MACACFAAALGTNRPRLSGFACGRGDLGGGAGSLPVSPAVVSAMPPSRTSSRTRPKAEDPGSIGALGRRETGAHRHLNGCHACEGRHPVSAGAGGGVKLAASGVPAAVGDPVAPSRLDPRDLWLLGPGLRLRRNRDDRLSVGFVRARPRHRSGSQWPPALRLRAAGVTSEGARGLCQSHRLSSRPCLPLGRRPGRGRRPKIRDPLVPLAGVRRERVATAPAVMPAKAGIQYPPGWAGVRRRLPGAKENAARGGGRRGVRLMQSDEGPRCAGQAAASFSGIAGVPARARIRLVKRRNR